MKLGIIRSVFVLASVFWAASCASDPYLKASLACIQKSATRAQADACRAKLDAGLRDTGFNWVAPSRLPDTGDGNHG